MSAVIVIVEFIMDDDSVKRWTIRPPKSARVGVSQGDEYVHIDVMGPAVYQYLPPDDNVLDGELLEITEG